MFVDYKADVEKPLPMIYQSGYLTIKDYDPENGEFCWTSPTTKYVKVSSRWLLPATWKLKKWRFTTHFLWLPRVCEIRRSCRKAFPIYFLSHPALAGREQLSPAKRADTGQRSCGLHSRIQELRYIFEFKLDGSASEALKQIEERQYARPYLTDSRTIIRIGVNFSSETMTVEGWEEAIWHRQWRHKLL